MNGCEDEKVSQLVCAFADWKKGLDGDARIALKFDLYVGTLRIASGLWLDQCDDTVREG